MSVIAIVKMNVTQKINKHIAWQNSYARIELETLTWRQIILNLYQRTPKNVRHYELLLSPARPQYRRNKCATPMRTAELRCAAAQLLRCAAACGVSLCLAVYGLLS